MAETRKPDFSGWVTRNDLLCSDGRIIRADAFAHQDGLVVPGCWNHQHNSANSVWGHVILHSVDGGVRGDAYVNDTPAGKQAKALVYNGDITNFSIYANHVKQVGKDVVHGTITEVSLVFAGANPGAKIDDIVAHDDSDGMTMVFYGEDDDTLFFHADKYDEYNNQQTGITPQQSPARPQSQTNNPNAGGPVTGSYTTIPKDQVTQEDLEGKLDLGQIIQSMTEEQKLACLVLIGMALENAKEKNPENQIQPGDIAPENSLTVDESKIKAGAPVDTSSANEVKPKEPVMHAGGNIKDKLPDQPDTPKQLPAQDAAAIERQPFRSNSPFAAAKERIQNEMAARQQSDNGPSGVGNVGNIIDTIPEDKKYLVDVIVGYGLSENKDPKTFSDPKLVADVKSLSLDQLKAIVELLGYMKSQQDGKFPAN